MTVKPTNKPITQSLHHARAERLEAKAIVTTTPTDKPIAQSIDHALAEILRAALLALPAELVEDKRCEIVKRDGKTLGYVVFEVRRLRVYVPDGHGKVMQIPVASVAASRRP